GDTWLISDIYLDGAISEVATRRSEFGAILKHEGFDGLIAALNRKANTLTANTQGLSKTSLAAEVAGVPAREPTTGAKARSRLPPTAKHQRIASKKVLHAPKKKHSPPISLALNAARNNRTMPK